MVKHSGWLVGGAREIKDVTARRNRNIEDAFSLAGVQDGTANLNSFRVVVRSQASIAKTECVVAEQLFRVLLRLAKFEEHSRGAQTDPRAVALYGWRAGDARAKQ